MVAVFVVDGRRRCRFLNSVAEVLTGVASAQARGNPLADVLWRGNPVPFENSGLARALDSRGGDGEDTIVDRDGALRAYAYRVVALGMDNDGGEGAIIELVDLSGETGTGRALRESERRLRLAVEVTGIGIWDVNAVNGRRRWSPEMYGILGVSPEAEADAGTFSRLIDPRDREAIDALFARAYSSPPVGTLDAEFRIVRPSDGKTRWIAVSGKVTYDASGHPLRGVGTIRDIDERRKTEEALRDSEEENRLAVEANDVGTWDHDIVAGTHRWSAIFKRLWGLPPDAPSDPQLLHALVSDRDWERIHQNWREMTDPSGTGRVTTEYEIRRADDGAKRWCSFAGRVYFDPMTGAPVRALGIMADVTERRAVEERQRLILREMNHRVKNTLALVQAIVSQTIRMTPDPNEAFERIQSRLMSLARTHDFLNRGDWAGVSLRALIQGEIEPLAGDPQRLVMEGEQVVLDSSTMFALGLTLHELASNAVRHGALSVPRGRVEIGWRVDHSQGKRHLAIEWIERNGPPVAEPARRGFGSRLIEANVGATLGGEASIEYAPTGLHARLSFPLKPTTAEDSFPEAATRQ